MIDSVKRYLQNQGYLSLIGGAGVIVAAYFAGFHISGMATADNQAAPSSVIKPMAKSAALRTSTTTLPSQTSSAWELPPFSLTGLDGEVHSLNDWKGKVIMLNFWATWCPPCQYEIPEFIRYQQQYGDKGLQIIGIGIDQARKLKNFVRTMEINYPVLVADEVASGKIMQDWGNSEQILPYTVIIDQDGRIHYIHRGEFSDNEFAEFVQPLLG